MRATADAYQPLRPARSMHVPVRGLRYHVNVWEAQVPAPEKAASASPPPPPLVLVHGWMDVGASFQFMVDALTRAEGSSRRVLAPDWRGFGHTQTPATDSYWFPDYLGDLDALLNALSPDAPVDLLGHSMGGNVVMTYAGVRPRRVRRLINLEGFGLPRTAPSDAPARLARWLDELQQTQSLRDYDSAKAVAQRLVLNNPRLPPARAEWLSRHWAEAGPDGRWHVLGDPAHKRTNPVLYRVEEHLEIWRRIEAPLLWVQGAKTEPERWWGGRYSVDEFHRRLDAVPRTRREVLADSGHMLHMDQPEALAALVKRFLDDADGDTDGAAEPT